MNRWTRALAQVCAWTAAVMAWPAPAAPSGQLVVQGLPPSMGIGQSAQVTLELEDLDGGPTTTAQPLTVTLSSSSSGAVFNTMNIWGAVTTSATIPTGGSNAIIAYSDMQAGTSTLVFDAGASWASPPATIGIGAETLDDDFESGTFNRWIAVGCSVASISIAIDASAAHRGDAGVRVTDNWGNNGGAAGTSAPCPLGYPFTGTIVGDYYARGWWRISNSNGKGLPLFATLGNFGIELLPGVPTAQVAWPFYVPFSPPFTYDAWHLVELGIQAGGTTDGGWSVWVDGVLAASQVGIDMSSAGAVGVDVGEPVSNDGSFVGLIDFDDVRAGQRVPASTLVISADGGAVASGVCNPVQVELRSSSGLSAVAPYDVQAALSSSAAGQFFTDATCTQSTAIATIAAGSPSAGVFFRPSAPGAASLQATQTDFLSAPTAVSITLGPAPWADAGLLAGRGFAVGCSCGTSAGAALLWPVVAGALALLARRPLVAGARQRRQRGRGDLG